MLALAIRLMGKTLLLRVIAAVRRTKTSTRTVDKAMPPRLRPPAPPLLAWWPSETSRRPPPPSDRGLYDTVGRPYVFVKHTPEGGQWEAAPSPTNCVGIRASESKRQPREANGTVGQQSCYFSVQTTSLQQQKTAPMCETHRGFLPSVRCTQCAYDHGRHLRCGVPAPQDLREGRYLKR